MFKMDIASISLYLIIVIASLAVYFIKRNLNYWKRQGIPHEEPHFIFGNFKGARSTRHMAQIVAELYFKFKGTGPFAGFHAIQRPAVVLLEKDLIKNVLIKDFNNFPGRGIYYNEKDDPLSGHLFLVEPQKWRLLRTKLSPTFTSGKMKFMFPTLLKVSQEFEKVLNEKVKENPIVDIRDLLSRYTSDIISSAAFGLDVNSLRNPNSEFPRLGKIAVNEQRHHDVIMALMDGFPKIALKLGMRSFTEDVHQFFMKTITETIEYREKNNIKRNDFLNILIDLKNTTNESTDMNGMTMAEMCAQVFVFFLGGFETSSSTMTYALYELAHRPDIQERLREEINETYEECEDNVITYEALNKMPYLNQVITETLRKYPSVAMLNREAENDYVVPGHPKYVIKAGMPVWIPILGIQNDPDIYPNPAEFDPDRFSPDIIKQRDPMEWLSFGDGPRNCIGERFGKMQTRLGLSTAIRNFHFSVCSTTEAPIVINPKSIAYTPKNVINLKLNPIKL